MKTKIFSIILVLAMLSALLVNVSAAAPGVSLTRSALSGGKYTVTVNFTNIPANNGVEYAQILLTCRSSQHSIVNNSLSMKVSGNIKVTQQFNTTADSLLVLIEPTVNTFAGINTGAVFTFTVSQSSGAETDPGFDVSAILILKDGTEQEINQRLSAALPNAPTNPTSSSSTKPSTSSSSSSSTKPSTSSSSSSNTTKPSTSSSSSSVPVVQDPCANGHTFQNGFCVYCAERDPNYDPCSNGHTYKDGHCIYCLAKQPGYNPCANGHTFRNGYCVYCLTLDPNRDPNLPIENPTTISTPAPTTVSLTAPTTIQPPMQDVVDDGADQTEDQPYWLLFLIIGAMVPVAILVIFLLTKKKK